jgi:high-affinity Fe2+/Pb2+ permease
MSKTRSPVQEAISGLSVLGLLALLAGIYITQWLLQLYQQYFGEIMFSAGLVCGVLLLLAVQSLLRASKKSP